MIFLWHKSTQQSKKIQNQLARKQPKQNMVPYGNFQLKHLINLTSVLIVGLGTPHAYEL